MVEPGGKTLFVMSSGKVSYKFVVTHRTKIQIDGAKASIDELGNQARKQVTVTFVARPSGNVAQSLSIGG